MPSRNTAWGAPLIDLDIRHHSYKCPISQLFPTYEVYYDTHTNPCHPNKAPSGWLMIGGVSLYLHGIPASIPIIFPLVTLPSVHGENYQITSCNNSHEFTLHRPNIPMN